MERVDNARLYLEGACCVQCGNQTAKSARQIRKYCSDECAKEYKRRIRRGDVVRTCEWCRGDLTGYPSRQKFCCEDCRDAGSAEYRRQRYDATAEERRRQSRSHYHSDPQRSIMYNRKWVRQNPEAVKRISARRRETPKGKLQNSIRVGVHRGITKGAKAGKRTFQTLGYTVEELMTHLQTKFLVGMSWSNYGQWHIDHKLPLASFEYETPNCDGFKSAWALSNLQPLWKTDNLKKGSRIFA